MSQIQKPKVPDLINSILDAYRPSEFLVKNKAARSALEPKVKLVPDAQIEVHCGMPVSHLAPDGLSYCEECEHVVEGDTTWVTDDGGGEGGEPKAVPLVTPDAFREIVLAIVDNAKGDRAQAIASAKSDGGES
jgi:hypothetical protein